MIARLVKACPGAGGPARMFSATQPFGFEALLKVFRGVAARYEKTAASHEAAVTLKPFPR
ncbi:hypothetical protein [Streptomyces sp. DASNCL29]|uniref:hypothetical protein n=1 Tax=Streptomyces sp. DASNCL29 TaxID=2583819 RepID=UPI00110F8DE3|nr:hypothetical protein [Streptomyces sp. DASNCL29]TMU94738.1 hypothetical protein FGK60_36750 [Streptomyces sp. DASNCL29]